MKIKVPANSGSGEALLHVVVEGARQLSGVSFICSLVPFRRAPPSGPNHLPEAPHLPTLPHRRLGFQRKSFGRENTLQSIAYSKYFADVNS